MIGSDKDGEEAALTYQIGGESSQPLPLGRMEVPETAQGDCGTTTRGAVDFR